MQSASNAIADAQQSIKLEFDGMRKKRDFPAGAAEAKAIISNEAARVKNLERTRRATVALGKITRLAMEDALPREIQLLTCGPKNSESRKWWEEFLSGIDMYPYAVHFEGCFEDADCRHNTEECNCFKVLLELDACAVNAAEITKKNKPQITK
jgi:hypothetical protein